MLYRQNRYAVRYITIPTAGVRYINIWGYPVISSFLRRYRAGK